MNNLCIGRDVGFASPPENPSVTLRWFDGVVRSFFREQHWKWEPPSLPQHLNAGKSDHPPAALPITSKEVGKELEAEASTNDTLHDPSKTQEETHLCTANSWYLERLQEVSDLTSLRKLRKECSTLPVDVARCSMAEFERLLKAQAPFNDVAEYLDDPILNHAASINTCRIVEHFVIHRATPEQCELIVHNVHKTLQQGILGESEEKRTLQLFPLVLLNAYGTENLNSILNAYQAVLNIYQSGNSRGRISDMILYRLLLQHLTDLPQGPQTNFALLLLQSALPLHYVKPNSALGSSLVKLAVQLIQRDKTKASTYAEPMNAEALSEAFDGLPSPFVKRWINAILSHLSKRKAGQATLKINDSHIMSATLNAMQLSIHFSKDIDDDFWKSNYSRALSVNSPSQIKDHLARLGSKRHTLVVLRHWLGKHTDMNYTRKYRKTRGRRLLASIKYTPISADVERVLLRYHLQLPQLDNSISWPVALVRAMRHFGRSPTRITAYFLEFFLAMEDHISFDAFAKCARGFLGIKLPRQILNRFLSLSTTSARTALLHLQLNDNICIDAIPNIQHGLMRNYKIRTKRILNLLFRSDQQKPSITRTRLNLIRSAAVDFACVPRFKWHLGYRNVRSCVQYLIEAGVEVDAILSRALVVVGLLRPMNEGFNLSKGHVHDVLNLVAFIEGPEVALRLEREVYSIRNKWSKPSDGGIYWKELKLDFIR